MVNFSNVSKVVYDNKVEFCGLAYMLTDDEAGKLKSFMDALISERGNVLARVETSAHAATPVVAPVEPKVYDHVTEGFTNFRFVRKDNAITITHADEEGTFLHEKAVRSALNARIKDYAFKHDEEGNLKLDKNGKPIRERNVAYDNEVKAWVFTSIAGKRDIKGATAFVTEHSNEVTADEINVVLDGWSKKNARKGAKA